MALLLWVRARSEALSRLIVAVEDSDADVQYSIVEYLNIERDGGLDASTWSERHCHLWEGLSTLSDCR